MEEVQITSLVAMDHLRQSVGLRGYAQKDPKQEYKREAFHLFESLLDNYQQEVCSVLLHYSMFSAEQLEHLEEHKKERLDREQQNMQLQHKNPESVFASPVNDQDDHGQEPHKRDQPKIGRNDKCYCGSGNKYKNCHGAVSVT
jgi:preprotein translocase subunit SecA